MKMYRAYFYYGRDRDDWRSHDFAAPDLTTALEKGAAMTPYGYNFWKVEHPIKTEFSFNKYLKDNKLHNVT
jgi:hypothetical protein